jgi:hypothetical protein
MGSSKVCPSCHSVRIRRAHKRGLLERVLEAVTGIRPYRCEECDRRFLSQKAKQRPGTV